MGRISSCHSSLDNDQASSSQIETVFKTYYRLLCFYAEQKVGKDVAEDIVSEIFEKLLENKELMKDVNYTLAYLRRSVHNNSLQYLKQVQKLRGYISYINENPDLIHLRDNNDPLSVIISMEMIDKIMSAINALPVKCREIFLLVHMKGYTPHQVAEKLKISPSVVYTQVSRAMVKIRKNII